MGAPSTQRVLHMSFSEDYSCIAIGTRSGVRLFDCGTGQCLLDEELGAISIVEVLTSSGVVALVGAGEQPTLSPRRLRLIDARAPTSRPLTELQFISSIVAVRMNQKRLIVLLERKVYIYGYAGQGGLFDMFDTCPNPKGICALSPSTERCYLALPASSAKGSILIYDAKELQTPCQIEAHQSPLAAMAFSSDGSLLASASVKGTVIRVHKLPQASKAYTFRRGSLPATVFSLAFGPPSAPALVLAVTTSHGTLHLFQLDGSPIRQTDHAYSALMAGIVPESMLDVVESKRSFSLIKWNATSGTKSLCATAATGALVTSENHTAGMRHDRIKARLVTSDGHFMEYGVDEEGSGVLEREFVLVEGSSQHIQAQFM